MKRYLISTITVLAVLAVAWAAFGQAGGATQRESMRQRFQNMSEEEREKFRTEMRGRGIFFNREAQEKAVKAIEEQLAKLRAEQIPRPEGGFQNLSEDERAELGERLRKVFRDRQNALQTIIAQVARLQGQRQPAAEGERYLIISASDLKPIQEAAAKEKATETAQLLERLIARGSGERGPGGRG